MKIKKILLSASLLVTHTVTDAAITTSAAPSCKNKGQEALCQTSCASSCRGFPPGFASAGCADEADCTNPPSWAAGSVCECTSVPPGPKPSPAPAGPGPQPKKNGLVGGYLLLKDIAELQVLAKNAATLPFTRIILSFVDPTLTYEPGSKTLKHTGLDEFVFADVASSVTDLVSGGVEVFLSMGGWNNGCNPYFYARYGSHTPNFWEIQQYAGGDIDKCVVENQFCYVCEPKSTTENTTMASYSMFPEPKGHSTWEQAKSYVESKASSPQPQWNEDMIPGTLYTDSKTGITVTLPGDGSGLKAGRNPYQDLIYLAKDLGVSGVDLDYEEMWHADYFKVDAPAAAPGTNVNITAIEESLFALDARPTDELGNYAGPWTLPQTIYKYAAIAKDIQLNIAAIYPSLKLATAAAAVGAWSSKWWGGNLKGLWYGVKEQFPDILGSHMEVAVMTYDLSSDEGFHECPDEEDCPLDKQVSFYMDTFKTANIPAFVGYEIGTPAYPNPVHDKSHQLPLTKDMLSSIISTTQPQFPGGFLWEIFKDVMIRLRRRRQT